MCLYCRWAAQGEGGGVLGAARGWGGSIGSTFQLLASCVAAGGLGGRYSAALLLLITDGQY